MMTLHSAGAVLPILSVLADVVFHHSARASLNENERRDALKVVRTKLTDTGERMPPPPSCIFERHVAVPCTANLAFWGRCGKRASRGRRQRRTTRIVVRPCLEFMQQMHSMHCCKGIANVLRSQLVEPSLLCRRAAGGPGSHYRGR